MFTAFFRSLDSSVRYQLKELKQIGKSSNKTNQGVKIIANSFGLMNDKVDKSFLDALEIYPFFKLTWKFKNKDKPIESVFDPGSKLIFLLKERRLRNGNT